MPVPNYRQVFLPLLRLAADEKEYSMREVVERLADYFELSDYDRKTLQPSSYQRLFDNRVRWAGAYLKRAGLLRATRRGYIEITSRGLEALKQRPRKIDHKFLSQYPEFVEFHRGKISD